MPSVLFSVQLLAQRKYTAEVGVNVLAFYSNNQSSNPAEDHKFSIKLL